MKKVGWTTVLIAATLTMFALTVGCQPSRDVELERIASAIEDSNEDYATLAGSVEGVNRRLNAIEKQIDNLVEQVGKLEEQTDTNDDRMRTYIATEIHKQLGTIENGIDDLASQVGSFGERNFNAENWAVQVGAGNNSRGGQSTSRFLYSRSTWDHWRVDGDRYVQCRRYS